MDYIKQWCLYICLTVIVAVIFSFLSPSGNLKKLYQTIISLFIFISFLLPLTQNEKLSFNFNPNFNVSYIENNTNSIGNDVIKDEINSVLYNYGIQNSIVECNSFLNESNEIVVESVQVAVGDEYDTQEIENLIYEKLSIRARVIHIGD